MVAPDRARRADGSHGNDYGKPRKPREAVGAASVRIAELCVGRW